MDEHKTDSEYSDIEKYNNVQLLIDDIQIMYQHSLCYGHRHTESNTDCAMHTDIQNIHR